MHDFSIRPRELDDDPQIIDIRYEANPDIPPMSLEEYRFQADPANDAPGVRERCVADSNGKVLGLYVLQELSFVDRPDTFAANIGVRLSERGKGIGGSLYNHMMERVESYGATRLYGEVSEDQSTALAFVERRGFSKTDHVERMSKLDVADANLEGYEGVVERLASQGIEIKTIAEIGMDDEPMLRKIHAAADETSRDVPGSEEFTGFPLEVFMKSLTAPGSSPEYSWVALDGSTPVGIARMERRGSASFNGYTGVAREYRGRGIARALKLKTIEWARESGIDSIITGNDMTNERMLSINIPLGYNPIQARIEVVNDLGQPAT